MTEQAITPTPAAFDILHLRPGVDLDELPTPDNGPYFLVDRERTYAYKNMFFGRVLVEVTELPTLDKVPGKNVLWLDLPPFPLELIGQAWSFFRWAWDERKSEAMLDITWREGIGYGFFVPPQTASAGGVKCIRNEEHYQGRLIGTIHSHCNGGAYHSQTDTHDADGHDGLHITMGRVSANVPDLDFMIAAKPGQWPKIPAKEVLAKGKIKMVAHPEWWNAFHEHPKAVEAFKNTKFASGAKPAGAITTTVHRGYQGGTYQPPLWANDRAPYTAPKTGAKPSSPFADHQAHELYHLGELITEGGLVEGVNPLTYHMNLDYVADILEDCLDQLTKLGLKTTFKAYADRALLKTYVENKGVIEEPVGWNEAFDNWEDFDEHPDDPPAPVKLTTGRKTRGKKAQA